MVVVATLTSLILGFSSVFVVFINGTILGLFIGFGKCIQNYSVAAFCYISTWYIRIRWNFLGLSFSLRLGLNG